MRGQSLRRCLETLAESGVCRNSLWPYDPNVADQSADEAPVQVRSVRTLVCASEALRKEAQDWSRKLAPQATNDVRVILCDSTCQDKELCGKRTFRHLGAFRKDRTKRQD